MRGLAGLFTRLPLLALAAQHPLRDPADAVEIRYAASQPVIGYTLRVDSADLSGFGVEVHVRNAGDTFRLAMAAHPEYDDRFWRFVEGISVTTPRGSGAVTREDSALWRVVAPGGDAVVRYRIRLPPAELVSPAAWRPFLAPSGGLVGGPHAFMYVLGATLAPAHVALDLPAGWDVATGLEPTADPRIFFAPSANILIDSPMLVGRLRNWRFSVDGVPYGVAYWPLPDATPFDTTALVAGLKGLVTQAVALFGRAPYREYTFQLRDGTFGSLEHLNSVTMGAPSATLAQGQTGVLAEAAHEYFHTWNLMRIRPVEYRGVDYRPPIPSRVLWWSEGITMLYADLLLRRAGLPTFDSTRTAHLASLMARYLGSPGNSRFSPERVSSVTYGAPPDALGDYSASVHLQGELLGTMLDFVIRDATRGARSLDDVMRLMLERFSGARGFTGADVERTVGEVCGCAVREFFDHYVRAGNPIEFNRYLGLLGLEARVTRRPVLGRDGNPAPDLAIRGLDPARRTGRQVAAVRSREHLGARGAAHGRSARRRERSAAPCPCRLPCAARPPAYGRHRADRGDAPDGAVAHFRRHRGLRAAGRGDLRAQRCDGGAARATRPLDRGRALAPLQPEHQPGGERRHLLLRPPGTWGGHAQLGDRALEPAPGLPERRGRSRQQLALDRRQSAERVPFRRPLDDRPE